MDPRRAVPVAVVAVVVGTLVYFTRKHGDAKPLEDPEAQSQKGPGQAVDVYETSGKNKRLTGEEPAALPPGHPGLPAGHPAMPPRASSMDEASATSSASDEGVPFTYAVPAGWIKQAPTNEMRKAQWSLPAEPGGEAGELYISPGISGGVAGNIERWAKQMGGGEAKTAELTVNGLKVTRVDVSGTFAGMTPPGGAPATPKSGWRLLGAVVEGADGLTFIKATGPAAVMAREEKAFDAFLSSFKPR